MNPQKVQAYRSIPTLCPSPGVQVQGSSPKLRREAAVEDLKAQSAAMMGKVKQAKQGQRDTEIGWHYIFLNCIAKDADLLPARQRKADQVLKILASKVMHMQQHLFISTQFMNSQTTACQAVSPWKQQFYE